MKIRGGSPMSTRYIGLVVTIMVCAGTFLPPVVQAQWRVDGVLAAPNMAGDTWITGPLFSGGMMQRINVVPDGAGGSFLTWRNRDSNIYAQHFNANGEPQWGPEGLLVCAADSLQFNSVVVSDGNAGGGCIVAWQDQRSSSNDDDIYAQRISSDGEIQWQQDGVPICTEAHQQYQPRIVSDGANGAIIVWADKRTDGSTSDIYTQRVDPNGNVLWTNGGVGLCTATGELYYDYDVIADNTGGAIVAWDGWIGFDLRAQKVASNGTVLWASNGVIVCSGGHSAFPRITTDMLGGAIVCWEDSRNPTAWDIYATRLFSANGASSVPNGLAICDAPGWQIQPCLASDGNYGAMIAWSDQRGSGEDIYAQRFDGISNVWASNGVPVCTAAGDQHLTSVSSVGTGPFSAPYITWWDHRNADADIYVQALDETGAPIWTGNGVAVCTASNDQDAPAVVPDAEGGAIVTWFDRRAWPTESRLYAERVDYAGRTLAFVVTKSADDGTLGTLRVALQQTNAIPGAQNITFDIPGNFPHTITPFTPLPPITDTVVLNGFTQPGSTPNTNPVGQDSNANYQVVIEFPDYTQGSGLVFQASGDVRGLVMNGGDATVDIQAPNVTVRGCYVGTELFGQLMGVNQQRYGIKITSINDIVGGPAAADRVVVGCSSLEGIHIENTNSVRVQGTYVGAASNLIPIGMPVGIHVLNGAAKTRIGTTSLFNAPPHLQEGNLIYFNTKGVVIEGATTTGNSVVGNSLFNLNMSIDLGNDGPSPNDGGDRDGGPNRMQNWPTLSSAVGNTISGVMDGVVSTTVYLHFYWSSSCCIHAVDYIGTTSVAISPFTGGPFSFSIPAPIPPGVTINATGTDGLGNTSEVSQPVTYYNTGSGSNSTANLVDADGKVYGTATFSNATATGNTYIQNPYTPPTLVSGYAIGNPNDPQIYYNITTNASYTGGVDICLNYDENNIPGPEANLVLLHYDGSMWQNVTTSRDPVNNKICGHVTSLSPFVIGAVTTTGVGDTSLPTSFALHANVPNPFNPTTTISYDVPRGGADVNIAIYDIAGRRVRELVNEHRTPGNWSVQWNGEDDRGQRVASGVYFYRMRAGSFVETRKMVLLK